MDEPHVNADAAGLGPLEKEYRRSWGNVAYTVFAGGMGVAVVVALARWATGEPGWIPDLPETLLPLVIACLLLFVAGPLLLLRLCFTYPNVRVHAGGLVFLARRPVVSRWEDVQSVHVSTHGPGLLGWLAGLQDPPWADLGLADGRSVMVSAVDMRGADLRELLDTLRQRTESLPDPAAWTAA